MADLPTGALEARGPLSQIGDAVVRKELGKLWNVIEGNAPVTNKPTEPHTWATKNDLTTLEAALSKRISEVKAQSQKLSVQSGGGTISGGSNLLPADNVWTGTNLWTTKATATIRPLRVESLGAGPLFVAAPTVMLPQDFMAAVDIQMTSDVADAGQLGGTAALYVQHRTQGAAGATALVSGIRVQMETTQGSTGNTINDAVGGYFTILNRGTNANGFGLHVDTYHAAAGNSPNTYGCDVEMLGSQYAQTGKTVGYLLRSWGQAPYTRRTDYGFLASPDRSGTQARIEYPFSVGSDWIGDLECGIAFDAGHCNANLAGLRLRTGSPIVFDGPNVNAWRIVYDGNGLRVQNKLGNAVTVDAGGDLTLHYGTLSLINPSTRAVPASASPMGMVQVNLGGFYRWIPFYA